MEETEVSFHMSPVHEAAKRGYCEQITEAIAESGKDIVRHIDTLGNTPLHWAASGGHAQACQLLLEQGADVNALNQFGDTPLHRAAWKNHIKTCELLLQHGAGPSREVKNKDDKMPVELARLLEVRVLVAPPQDNGPDEDFDQDDADSD